MTDINIFINEDPRLKELKKVIDLLHDDANYNSILPYTHTKEEADLLYNSFLDKIKGFYDDIDGIQGKKLGTFNFKSKQRKLLIANNYFLFDDFDVLSNPQFLEDQKAIKNLIYSPLSINFLSKILKKSFNPYFTENDEQSKDTNNISASFTSSFMENVELCPGFLKDIFNLPPDKIKEKKIKPFFQSPNELFEDLVIKKNFEDPYFFNTLYFNEIQKVDKDESDLFFKNSIKGKSLFLITELFGSNGQLDVLPSKFKTTKKRPLTETSMFLMNKFRNFLRKCTIKKEISPEISKMPFLDQLKNVLNYPKSRDNIKQFKDLVSLFSKIKDIESFLIDGLIIIHFEINLNELSNLINDTLFFVKCYLIAYQNEKLKRYSYKNYINDTTLFLNDISREVCGYDGDVGQLTNSTITADKSDPYFMSVLMLLGMTLEKFIQKRPGLRMLDQSYDMKVEDYKKREEYQYEPLMKLKENYQSKFIEIAKFFSLSFSKDKDPYNMMRCISKAYAFALNEIKKFKKNINNDSLEEVTLEEEEEDKFIISLLLMVRPQNIFSTYIYFYEFLLSPKYEVIFSESNKHFDTVKKIFQAFISIFIESDSDFNIAEHCSICQRSVKLVLKNEKEVLHKLANIISDGKSDLEEMYKKTFNIFSEKSVIANSSKQFTFRVYSNDENDPLIWICNVTLTNDKSFDEVPLDSKENLEIFLKEKEEEEEKNLKEKRK